MNKVTLEERKMNMEEHKMEKFIHTIHNWMI
jgi:hypothetical protein